jgi:hypothetical protein
MLKPFHSPVGVGKSLKAPFTFPAFVEQVNIAKIKHRSGKGL